MTTLSKCNCNTYSERKKCKRCSEEIKRLLMTMKLSELNTAGMLKRPKRSGSLHKRSMKRLKRSHVKRSGVKRSGMKRSGMKRSGKKRSGKKRSGKKRDEQLSFHNFY